MRWIHGRSNVIIDRSRPRRRTISIFLPMLREPMTWLNTEPGIRRRNTVTSGHLRLLRPVGRLIKMVVGCGYPPGVGRGSMPRPGALRRFTMVVGLIVGRDGAGYRGHDG